MEISSEICRNQQEKSHNLASHTLLNIDPPTLSTIEVEINQKSEKSHHPVAVASLHLKDTMVWNKHMAVLPYLCNARDV